MFSKEPHSFHPLAIVKTSALAAFVCATAFSAHAQQVVPQAAVAPDSSLLAVVSNRPMNLADFAGVGYSSSTDSVSDASNIADPDSLNLSGVGNGEMQPPPRRRYGNPRYSDRSHNADGSNKYTFVGAVGFELPLANTYHYFNTSYAFQVGGGRQFSKKFAILAQFDYDKFGINGATLQNQATIYDYGCAPGTVAAGTCGIPEVDGNNHIWSLSLDPVYTFAQGDKYGAYVVGGVGFYHKVTDFTTPETGCYYDYFGDCYPVTENETFDHYTSNAPGFNGGFGLTYKFSRFADEKFFIEGRYVFVDNSQKQGYTAANVATTTYSGSNYFPANSNRTTYIPIKVGIRF